MIRDVARRGRRVARHDKPLTDEFGEEAGSNNEQVQDAAGPGMGLQPETSVS